MHQPVLLGLRGDRERRVPHPQPRVAAGVGVRRRAAPVLHEEQPEALLGRAEVLLGVQRPQHRVVGHALVELRDDPAEGLVAADLVVEGRSVVTVPLCRAPGERLDTGVARLAATSPRHRRRGVIRTWPRPAPPAPTGKAPSSRAPARSPWSPPGIGTYDVSWPSRAEEANGKTSPEELIAAAHSSCFSMALLQRPGQGRHPGRRRWTPGGRRLRARHRHHRHPAHRARRRRGHQRGGLRRRRRGRQGGCPVSQALTAHHDHAGRPRWPEPTGASAGARRPGPPPTGVRRGRRGVGVDLGRRARLVAVPDDPLGERDLDALVVEAGLDPLAQLAGDRPLLHRGGLERTRTVTRRG